MNLITLLNVSLVIQDVLNVKNIQKTVLFVTITEFNILILVHVTMVIPKLMTTVNHVTIFVKLVKNLKEIVLFVLQTDMMPQLVYVQMELMMLNYKLTVHIVNHNVLDVMLVLKTVSLVLKDMLTHQAVQSLHQKFLLLKLLISQLVQSKLLTVLFLVKLVKNILILVSFVMLTELTHQHVVVSQDISLIQPPENVLNVITDVQLVMLFLLTLNQNVLLVLKIVLDFPHVSVQMDSMISKTRKHVKDVQLNVLLVITMDVSLVLLTESIQELVIVEKVCMKILKDNVKFVQHTV